MTRTRQLFITSFLVAITAIAIMSQGVSAKAETLKEEFTVTPGVIYKDYRFNLNSRAQASRILDINLNQPNVKVEAGIPNPINTLSTVSARTQANTYEQHRVVGGINASFFHTDTKLPAYLVAWKEDVGTLGVISTGFDEYMSVPTAFGINSNGTAQIDRFEYDSSFEVNGQSAKINSINKERGGSEVIVYTPTYRTTSTRTNSYGMEIVVTNTSVGLDEGVYFGKSISGTVHSVTSYGKGNSDIPRDGYVISIQGGEQAAKFSHVKPGQEIKLNINVENKWKNSEFMLASGPMLVKDGKVDMTISETSSRATTRAPRTAVAIDKSGKRVFFVTVDGRQTGYSTGMTLKELAQYLVSIGADRAINLDGGGSTSMVVRRYGNLYPTTANSPSDGRERAVSAILQVVSTAPDGQPTQFEFKKSQEGTLLKSQSINLEALYALDENFHRIQVDSSKVVYSVEGNVGRIEGNKFVATSEGNGYIVGKYGNAIKKVPISVTETPSKIEIAPSSLIVGPNTSTQLTVKAYDEKGNQLVISPGIVKWSVTNGIGTITPEGIFSAGSQEMTGKVQAAIYNSKGEANITVGNKAVVLHTFDSISMWKGESAKSSTMLSLSSSTEPHYHGTTALKVNYDFTGGESGIKASYATLQNPIQLTGRPNYIGLWVYGDGNRHWLRGKLLDGSGKEHTINFTEEGKLDWKGWRYVRATIPANISLPIKFTKFYIAESYPERQGKGVMYFDKLQAEYGSGYKEPMYNDVPNNHIFRDEISYLSERGIITGYSNGYFQPNSTLTRAHAAVLLVRALQLPATSENPNYQDVYANHPYYKEIAAITKAGVMNGKKNNTIFDPEGTLTRAQMAVILARAYQLTGTTTPPFTDVAADYWAYKEIHALSANQITTGYKEDHTFRPENFVTRGQFSAFIYRAINK